MPVGTRLEVEIVIHIPRGINALSKNNRVGISPSPLPPHSAVLCLAVSMAKYRGWLATLMNKWKVKFTPPLMIS